MPQSIIDLVSGNKDMVSNILISGIGGITRYLNDVRNGANRFEFYGLVMSFFIAASIGYGLYGVISKALGITDPSVISSISFVSWLLGRELINAIVKVAPGLFSTVLPSILTPAAAKAARALAIAEKKEEKKNETLTDA